MTWLWPAASTGGEASWRAMREAFIQFLERLDPQRLPLHGGDVTTVVVTIPLDALRRELGGRRPPRRQRAWEGFGDTITAAHTAAGDTGGI